MASTTGNRWRPDRARRGFASLAGSVLLLGVADSMTGSYLVLFAADQARLSPAQVGVFAAAPAAGGIVLSAVAGRRFDRRPTRTYAAGAALLGALGVALLTTTTSFVLLVLVAVTLLAAQQVVFPQLFAQADVTLAGSHLARRAAPLLRSGWSLAWALGPLVSAALLPWVGFSGVLLTAAGILVLTALTVATIPASSARVAERPVPHDAPAQSGGRAGGTVRLGLLVTSVVLFFLAMFAGSLALPLYVTRGLHEPDTSVGLLYSACAAVEVVAALALAALPDGVSRRALIAGGMGALVVYFAVTVVPGSLALLLVGQVFRGVAIAVVGAAGIRLFQQRLAPATGRATALFSNSATAGGLLAGVLGGQVVQHQGYVTALALCGAAALLGAVAFWPGSAPRRPAPSERCARLTG